MLQTLNITIEEKKIINLGFVTIKHIIYVANINENNFKYKNNF
ncbi:MAG: hypothetical protein ACSLEJ_00150 [Candidatus Makana argininalis]